MSESPITPGDSFAAVVAELREGAQQLQSLAPGLSVEWNHYADRIERLDAEMRKSIDYWRDGSGENLRRAMDNGAYARRLSDENEQLRAKLAACESEIEVLRRYGNKMCTAMADEYMRSDEYLASRAAGESK